MSQVRLSVVISGKGSMNAVWLSGMTSMSDASIPAQPRIDEASKPSPSSKVSSLNSPTGIVKCCQLPWISQEFEINHFDVVSLRKGEHFFGCHWCIIVKVYLTTNCRQAIGAAYYSPLRKLKSLGVLTSLKTYEKKEMQQ